MVKWSDDHPVFLYFYTKCPEDNGFHACSCRDL
jgi:hypothetical protein